MNSPSHVCDELIQALRCLPGVGPKSAQRMAYHLLQRDQPGAHASGRARITRRSTLMRHCERCNTFTEEPVCELCRSPGATTTLLCVVETPADLLMMEQTQCYRGQYFVLMGRLSPLDGIGPREISSGSLLKRAGDGVVQRSDPGHQFHRRGRSHRALHR